ncbi:MAG: EamA family transporter [Bacillota bacterium]|nr:EamA family transporter [Bacillota bacterium]
MEENEKVQDSRKIGISLVLAGGVCWGFIGIFVQAIGPVIDPFTLSILRLGAASLLMVPIIVRQKGFKAFIIPRKNLRFFVLFGLAYWAVYQILYFTAIQMISAGVAVVLLYTAPFFIIILARLFLGEAMTARKVAASVLGFIGVGVMFSSWAASPSQGMAAGGLMALGAGFCYATYYIYVKKALASTDPLVTSFYSMFFGFAWLTVVTAAFFRGRVAFQPDLRTILLIIGLAAVSTTIGGTLNILGMRRIEAGEAGVFALVEPITTLIVSWFLFGSTLQGWQILGAAMILFGGYLVYRQPE